MPVPSETGGVTYQGIAGEKSSQGNTIGEALDALIGQFTEEESGMFIVVESLRPDQFFGTAQQQRLEELMGQWRTARDTGQTFAVGAQAELDTLIEAELNASAARAAALADE